MINDKTILRLQKITGQPISRGIDKTINTVLDQLDVLKASNPDPQENESKEVKIIGRDCKCEFVEADQKSDEDESQDGE